MVAEIKIHDAGNTAMEMHEWRIPTALAKRVLTSGTLNTKAGTYWAENFAKPVRRAIRAGAAEVRIYTAGFSSGELAQHMPTKVV